ncbi:MAG: MerR family transcriptional regulator [Pseudomonadota bacterium]
MSDASSEISPTIPAKRYFTIGEVSQLCALKSHVLRYWEQEFPQLQPNKRRGNRRYYQRHDVELICRIRYLLYEKGFTIEGARQQLAQRTVPQPVVTREQIVQLRAQVAETLQLLSKPLQTIGLK